MGRRTILNKELSDKFCQGISLGMKISTACNYAGISESVYYRWQARGLREPDGIYAEFIQAVWRARGRGCATHLAVVARAAREGNWQASAWMLERCHGYRREAHIEVTTGAAELSEVGELEVAIRAAHALLAVDDLVEGARADALILAGGDE